MTSTLPPDPYAVLGVSQDADPATIKSTYRKLALKCHPDKVTDESLKQQKQEEFHKIQQAYEILCDVEERAKYDAQVRLEKLRKERGPPVDVKTARYETRAAAPAGATFGARYEERRPKTFEDSRYFEERAAKNYDTYEAYPRATRSSRDKEASRSSKPSADRTRSERTKTRDREERRERSGKFVYVEDDSSSTDEKARYESDYRRRSDDDRRRHDEDEIRRKAAEDRRKAEDRRSYEEAKEPRRHRSGDTEFDRQRKLNEMQSDAVRYIHRSKVEAERPSATRTSSSRDVRPDPYESRSSRSRPEAVRRSSARPKDRPSSSGRDSHRDRKGVPEIVDWEEERRVPPTFKHSSSSPAEIHIPRVTPQRSQTEYPDGRRASTSPTPKFRRSETMPTVPSSRSRKEGSTRPSGLRASETADLPAFKDYPTIPPPRSTTTYYHYPTPGGGISLHPEDVGLASNGHRTILHEPSRHRARSPSPLSRPPMGANRPVVAEPVRMTSSSSSAIPPPPLGRSSSRVSPTRGRSERLYGEVTPEYVKRERENARHQTKFEKVSYAPKIGPEDIRWSASRGREAERERGDGGYAKPSMPRYAPVVH